MCGIHLDRQDPFAEVDLWVNYRMQETPQNLVNRAFGRHDITLHIDDGCMGGGGLQIPYSGKLFDNKEGTPNYIQYKHDSVFFSKDRIGIFHYAIFCKYIYHIHCTTKKEMKVKTDGLAERAFTDKNGNIRQGGDWMLFAIPYAIHYYGSSFVDDEYVASLFMHELGHNIGLFEDNPNWGCMEGAFTKIVDYEDGWSHINPSVIQYCGNDEV